MSLKRGECFLLHRDQKTRIYGIMVSVGLGGGGDECGLHREAHGRETGNVRQGWRTLVLTWCSGVRGLRLKLKLKIGSGSGYGVWK